MAVVALALALLAAAVGSGCGGGGDEASGPAVASTELPALDGDGSIVLSEGGERPIVANLWATWCAPCRAELPAFDEVAAAAEGQVDVIGVNVGETPEQAGELAEELDLAFAQYLDEDSELLASLEVVQMPATAFIDADGELVEVHSGAYTAEELVAAIEENLGESVSLPAP